VRFHSFIIVFVVTALQGIVFVSDQKKNCKCEKRSEGPKPAIISAATKCDLETVASRIANGESIESKDAEGNTVLKYSIENKCEALVNLLLSSGANASAASIYGRTPFMSAVSAGSVDLVQRLTASGCDVNFKDKFGQHALFYANDIATVKVLVEAGANVNVSDHIKMTPLMQAVMGCDEETVVYLVEHGADLNARNSIGVTPLSFAYCSPYPRILRSLISAGANIDAQDNEGLTPLMRTMGYPDTTEQFIEAGADVNIRDRKGRTALDHAMKIDTFRKEIIQILRNAGAVSGRTLRRAGRNGKVQ
jgi:ankyrin repeat protein